MIKVNDPEYKFEKKKFENFCNQYQLEFPKEFIDYLKKHNCAEIEPNTLDIGDNECDVRYFYGTSNEEYTDIWATYEAYKERIPKKCVPIADVDFGNQLCISLQEETYGKIYFWDHETMDIDNGVCEINIEDMNEIASSFDELLDIIVLDDIEEPILEAGIEQKANIFKKFIYNMRGNKKK